MPGMNSGLSPADPTLVAAFRSALLHQGFIALLIIAFLGLLWATARVWRPATAAGVAPQRAGRREPRGRMAAAGRVRPDLDPGRDLAGAAQDGGRAGLAGHRADRVGLAVLGPAPGQLGRDHLVLPPHHGRRGLGVDPGRASASGCWSRRTGTWSRLAGLAAVAWGLVVWVFGESFGGIFAPGLSWLTGAPGAVLIYVVAGALVALPEDAWRSPRLGRLLLAGTGVFFLGMAVLQAWPGRGFWQGTWPWPAGHAGRHGPADGRRPRSRTSCPPWWPASARSPRATASRSTWWW